MISGASLQAWSVSVGHKLVVRFYVVERVQDWVRFALVVDLICS